MAFLTDTFTDTDAVTLQNHTPDTGGVWEELGFNLSNGVSTLDSDILANKLVGRVGGTPSRVYRNAVDPVSNEYTIDISFVRTVVNIRQFGLYARLTPTGTAFADVDSYMATYVEAGGVGSIKIFKTVSGSETELASGLITLSSASHNVKFLISDDFKAVSVDGVFRAGTSDNSITQVGRVGVCTAGVVAHALDDLSAAGIGSVADYPAVGDVEKGVTFDSGGQTGTLLVPAVGDVETGVQFGAGDTEFTGTFDAPAVGDVQDAVTFGNAAEFTGTFTEPGVTNVTSGVQYGAGGTEFTGTLVAASGSRSLAIRGALD